MADKDQVIIVKAGGDKGNPFVGALKQAKVPLAILAVGVFAVAWWLREPEKQNAYDYGREGVNLGVFAAIAAGCGVVLLAAVVLYIIVRLALNIAHHRAEIAAVRMAARQVHADGGVYPLVFSRSGDAAVNPNAAPGGIVEGLNGRPRMPDAETPAAADAVARASFVQVAASAGARGAAALLDILGAASPKTPEMPPLMVWNPNDQGPALPGDMHRLLELASGEYRMLTEEGADDE